MLFVYVLGIPAAAVLKLWLNRKSGAGLTRAELAARDGPLVTLTRKYSPQYWWFEAVCIGTRLCFCGLAVFFFPEKPVLRLALCLIAISFNIWFCERYRPVSTESMSTVMTGSCTLLWLLVVAAIVSTGKSSDMVQLGCSCALTGLVAGMALLLRHIKNSEPDFAMVNAIENHEPFDSGDFEAAVTERGAAHLAELASTVAAKIAKKPTHKAMKRRAGRKS